MNGHPAFIAALEELKALHISKQADYGTDDDPFANYRSAEEIGIPAWKAALSRAMEKTNRLKTFCNKGTLKNESVEDSMMDASNCFLIALVLYRESVNAKSSNSNPLPELPDARPTRVSDR